MGPFLKVGALASLLALVACGPAPSTPPSPQAAAPVSAKPRCPDPRIKDSTNPCSPNYYKPVKGSFKGQKSF